MDTPVQLVKYNADLSSDALTIEMVLTHIDVKVFNIMRYAVTSLLLAPCLEWALQNIVESFGAIHLLRGGIVRWGGHRLGRLSPVPYSFSRMTRFIAIGAGILIHAISLLGEYGFDAQEIELFNSTGLLAADTSTVSAYIPICDLNKLRIYYLNDNPELAINRTFNTSRDCAERRDEYFRTSRYNYGVLNEEISSNINSVSSTVTEEADLDWQAIPCTESGEGGIVQHNFKVLKSDTREYRNRQIDLQLHAATTTLHVTYGCGPKHLENISSLPAIFQAGSLGLRQNNTFTCISTRELRRTFCFFNITPSVREVYAQDEFSGFGIRIFAEFDPPVKLARMYFILSGMQNYKPQIQEFDTVGTYPIMRSFITIGNLFTVLSSMEEVIAYEGRNVRYISDKRVVATITKQGFAFLGVLSLGTLSALSIALLYKCIATKDSEGRVVKVKSEPKYIIDLVANSILGEQDGDPAAVSEFGIALTTHGRGRPRICVNREGIPYEGGGIIGGRPEQAQARPRKRKRLFY